LRQFGVSTLVVLWLLFLSPSLPLSQLNNLFDRLLSRRCDRSDYIAQTCERFLKISGNDGLVLDDQDLCLGHEALDPSFVAQFGERERHGCACIPMELEGPVELLDQHRDQLPP
jgi:hypothetical protein